MNKPIKKTDMPQMTRRKMLHRMGMTAFKSFALILLALVSHVSAATSRDVMPFDSGWKFQLADVPNSQSVGLNDADWRLLDLPHDWSIEGKPEKKNPSGASGGYFPCGIGWYRKSFSIPTLPRGTRVFLQFDGVYMNSTVWVNGRQTGHRAYGYIGFEYDITEYVHGGDKNIVAVRVDNSHQPNDRWYGGSGIYRRVRLVIVSDLYIPQWGVCVTTPEITSQSASVMIVTELANDFPARRQFELKTVLAGPDGSIVASQTRKLAIEPRGKYESKKMSFATDLKIPNPLLWDTSHPHIYKAITSILEKGSEIDRVETPFGIRTVAFVPGQGLLLNGRRTVMKGVCLHHDAGCVGSAVPQATWRYRLNLLKEMGCNAVRLSHNPHSPELLDLCDRMGILVYNEAYDKWNTYRDKSTGKVYWDFFKTWQQDLGDFVRRDRNHPSVIIWSVGNEVIQQTSNPVQGAQILQDLVDCVHKMDPTRKVTCALHPGGREEHPAEPSIMTHFMDVASYNYQTQTHGLDHIKYPQMVMIDSELYPWYSEDILEIYPQDNTRDPSGRKFVPVHHTFALQDYVAGQFIWAGIAYLGEAAGGWPIVGWSSCPIDTCGHRQPVSYFIQSRYSEKPMVHLAVMDDSIKRIAGRFQWTWPPMASHWNFQPGRELKVAAFTNCDSVELLLNGRSLGTQKLEDFQQGYITWRLPFETGVLRAIATKNGVLAAEHRLKTAGNPIGLRLSADRTDLDGDGQDVAHVSVSVVDADGTLIPDARHPITFEVEGPGKIIGVDNGSLSAEEPYKGNRRNAYQGKCFAMIQVEKTARDGAMILLRARSGKLKEATLRIMAKEPERN